MSSRRIPELDGIRGLAIALVVVFHFIVLPIAAQPGTFWSYIQAAGRLMWTGVDLFFVLSGFLIGGILLDSRESPDYFRRFYLRRFFRIVPIYAVVVIAMWFYVNRFRAGWANGDPIPWYSYPLFLQNFWMAAKNESGVFGVSWSLAVEEQFYLTLPAMIRFVDRKWLPYVVAAGIVLAPVLRMLCFFYLPEYRSALFLMMPCRADALLLGVAGALAVRDHRARRWLVDHPQALWAALAILTLGACMFTLRFRSIFQIRMVLAGYTWIAVLYLCVLLIGSTHPESWLAGCLRWRWLRWLGAIAYGVYLIHYQLLEIAFRSLLPHYRTSREIVLSGSLLVFTLVLCSLSWRLFEKPLIALGHRLTSRRVMIPFE
jgi:peptidoglycan/LPS O-acetylase OafA/YrhL